MERLNVFVNDSMISVCRCVVYTVHTKDMIIIIFRVQYYNLMYLFRLAATLGSQCNLNDFLINYTLITLYIISSRVIRGSIKHN